MPCVADILVALCLWTKQRCTVLRYRLPLFLSPFAPQKRPSDNQDQTFPLQTCQVASHTSECSYPINRTTQSHDQNLLLPIVLDKDQSINHEIPSKQVCGSTNSSEITHVAPNPILQCWHSNIKVTYQHSAVFQKHTAASFQTHFSTPPPQVLCVLGEKRRIFPLLATLSLACDHIPPHAGLLLGSSLS